MMRVTAALVAASVAGLLAQDAQRPLSFDVTSVTPNTSGQQGGSSSARPGRYLGVNVTLRRVIGLAYRPVREFAGGPEWIDTERFDIEGRSERTPTQPEMLEMLRSLLAERFKLVVHTEVRSLPAFALVMARADGRTGPQLRRTDPCVTPPPGPETRPAPGPRCGGFRLTDGSLTGTGVTMTQLAAELPADGRHVIDRTGLGGSFDITLTWNADALQPSDAPSIFAALQEQLGLKLEPITAPIEVIVIDHAERPSAN
jgi:uncharacterized protein (TIGR03435 family)